MSYTSILQFSIINFSFRVLQRCANDVSLTQNNFPFSLPLEDRSNNIYFDGIERGKNTHINLNEHFLLFFLLHMRYFVINYSTKFKKKWTTIVLYTLWQAQMTELRLCLAFSHFLCFNIIFPFKCLFRAIRFLFNGRKLEIDNNNKCKQKRNSIFCFLPFANPLSCDK